ncbi:MAG: hypothetical protein PWQ37_2204 [Candidatus Petromonas sp.]|nr:hypothetical protein [Candidatus Petromonas sp.]
MVNDCLNIINPLDKIRLHMGVKELKNFFHELVENNTKKAIKLLNDENLHFPSLFILKSTIEEFSLLSSLNSRNRIALEITDEILTNSANNKASESLPSDYIQTIHSVLKWILDTGFADDGINNKYDKLLDIAATLITKIYKDKTFLPTMVDMIFNRHRRGFFIHDLVWAFFECRDPESLVLIANRLQSSHPKDFELACKLLGFIPCIDMDDKTDKEEKYLSCLNWIEDNSLFLYFTGESFQQTPHPKPYAIAWEAKYLCKIASTDTGEILKSLTKEEYKLLDEFRKLDDDTKTLLSNFSFRLHRKNMEYWNDWIQYPIEKQIQIAIRGEYID